MWQEPTCRSVDSIVVTIPMWNSGLVPACLCLSVCVLLYSLSARCPRRKTKATAHTKKGKKYHVRFPFPSCRHLYLPVYTDCIRCLVITIYHCTS